MRHDSDRLVERLLAHHTPDASEAEDWGAVVRRSRDGARLAGFRRRAGGIPTAIGGLVLAALIGALIVAAPGDRAGGPIDATPPTDRPSPAAQILAAGRDYHQRDEETVTTTRHGGFAVARWVVDDLTVAHSGEATATLVLGRAALARADQAAAWQRAGSPDLDPLVPRSGDVAANSPQTEAASGFFLGTLWEALTTNLGPDPLGALPSEPGALRAALRRLAWFERVRISGDAPCAEDWSDCSPRGLRSIRDRYFQDLMNLLRYPLTPPALAARVRGVLAGEEGVRAVGPLSDARGRTGEGFLLPPDVETGRDIVLVDPTTSALIATGQSGDPAHPTGENTAWSGVFAIESGPTP